MICAVCKKEVTELASRSTRCKPCHNIYTRKHYRDNKRAYAVKARRNEKKRMDLIRKIKDVPCSDCGREYHYCQMDFDHIKGDKEFNIASHGKAVSLEKLRNEIDKCELVCANCHRMRTLKRLHGDVA